MSVSTSVLVVSCIIVSGLGTFAFATEPGDVPTPSESAAYKSCLSRVATLLNDRGPLNLRVNWNPKAPSMMQADYEYDIALLPDRRIVALHKAPNVDCAIYFADAHVYLVNNKNRVCVKLDGIDLDHLAQTTDTLAGIHAVRLLLGVSAYLYLKELAGADGRTLDARQTRAALRELYRDEAGNAATVGPSELQRISGSAAEGIEWRDRGGAIFSVVLRDADRASIKHRLEAFKWAKSFAPKTRPKMIDLLRFLDHHSVSIAPGSQVALQTSKGILPAGARPTTSQGFYEMCHVICHETRVGILVGDGWGTPVWPRCAFDEQKDVVVTKQYDDAGIVCGSGVNLKGQDWALGYVLPGGADPVQIEKTLTPLLIRYLNTIALPSARNAASSDR